MCRDTNVLEYFAASKMELQNFRVFKVDLKDKNSH